MNYETVIGLEVHVELRTQSKMFCACSAAFGGAPNSQVCPVCMGLPGALPALNAQAVRLAVLAGLAVGAQIQPQSRFDRKHYFYPDLPKGYQISQFYEPLCLGGHIRIETAAGDKTIGIARIHMEEDAGRLLHDGQGETLLDLNRCGVPLIEIVSQPDLRGAEEAVAYLRKLRGILTYAGVSDCKMNEGSLRCDVNLSLRKPGQPLGVRTEMKNLNSFQSVERAIEAERARQRAALEQGDAILQETRGFDAKTGCTYAMRPKENSGEYRFFPEPDLPALSLTETDIEALRTLIPALPEERKQQFQQRYGLTPYAAEQLTAERELAEYFEKAAKQARHPVTVANLLLGEVFAQMALRATLGAAVREAVPPIAPQHLAALADLLAEGRVNSSTGNRIVEALFETDCDPEAYAAAQGLFVLTEEGILRELALQAMTENPALVDSYRAGKTKVLQALMGKAMALSQGKAQPEQLQELLVQALAETKL